MLISVWKKTIPYGSYFKILELAVFTGLMLSSTAKLCFLSLNVETEKKLLKMRETYAC